MISFLLANHFIAFYSKKYNIKYSPTSEVFVKYPDNLRDWINQKRRSAGGYNQIKKWSNVEIRSFYKESLGGLDFFRYITNLKEFLWLWALFLVRIYLWLLIYRDINIKNKEFNKIWVRIESTK